jgi:hypothetical protein
MCFDSLCKNYVVLPRDVKKEDFCLVSDILFEKHKLDPVFYTYPIIVSEQIFNSFMLMPCGDGSFMEGEAQGDFSGWANASRHSLLRGAFNVILGDIGNNFSIWKEEHMKEVLKIWTSTLGVQWRTFHKCTMESNAWRLQYFFGNLMNISIYLKTTRLVPPNAFEDILDTYCSLDKDESIKKFLLPWLSLSYQEINKIPQDVFFYLIEPELSRLFMKVSEIA